MLEFLKKVPVVHGICHYLKKWFLTIWIPICRFYSKHFVAPSNDISEMKDVHKGKRCFIVATGPSLTMEDLDLIKNEYTISMNSIINLYDKTDFRPTYYMIQDGLVERRLRSKLQEIKLDNMFIGLGNVYGFGVNISQKVHDKFYPESKAYNLDVAYHIMEMCYSTGNMDYKFSDHCEKLIYDGCTVTYSAIQLAVYMGFTEIYLLGCDTNFAGHVDDVKKEIVPDAGTPASAWIDVYNVAEKYARSHNIKIFNATRGGMLEVFQRVEMDKLF